MTWDNLQDLFDALAAPFPVEEVSWRVGPTNERYRNEGEPLRGTPLCYIDARAVMDRLDSVVGFDGWQANYTPGVGTSIVCNIALRFPVIYNGNQIGHEWVWKGDGAGATDMEAEKGALSDAFKRSAVRWGIGRYLYEIKAPRITLEQRGKTAIIPEEQERRLEALYQDHVKRIAPIIGVNAYRQAYRLLIGTINTVPIADLDAYAQANGDIINGLPGAMRDHVLLTIHKRKAA
jgi:hypothetical protein